MAKFDNQGYITELDDNEIFVFGSNGQGAHLGGAAATAVQKFGAKMGQAEGLQGQSYAINTMDSEDEMYRQISRFLRFAINHLSDYKFYVTEIGCGIAGYSPDQIAPHFAYHWQNVVLPESFEKSIDKYMDGILKDHEKILCFEYGMGGAMGGNQGGVWFWYLDKNNELRSWHALASKEFFEFGKTASKEFAQFPGGAGNFIYINKEAKYLDHEEKLGLFLNLEFNGVKCRVKCDSMHPMELIYHLKENSKIKDCDYMDKHFIIG
ncbi:hypothetical protein IKF81_00335 [Candidatus Saccharibacteria bacterium]|nr:hypothetical protein [Candidatus Saccharibacteria bacterium]